LGFGYWDMAKIVSSGLTSVVSSAVTDIGDIVLLGGVEIALSGGTASGTTVSSCGILSVRAGGTVASTTIAGGTVEILNGGVVGSGGFAFTGSGGTLRID